ncbi:hypothetical protein [Corallococcus sp. CA047B]|uniref:hypothetical protein n=1 Tax=Corallococcus sp. CA047B TaxID=2316729 RepID=UPI000EA0F6CD|nr:hypothetical protein [Corallococcus sp. CA047B]
MHYRVGLVILLAYPGDRTEDGAPDANLAAEVWAYRVDTDQMWEKSAEGALDTLTEGELETDAERSKLD